MANLKIVLEMVRQLAYIMNRKQQRQCIVAFIAMLISAVFETLGVSVIIPFIISISQPEELMKNEYARIFMDLFHITTPTGLMIIMALGVIIIYILKNAVILISNYIQIRFRNNLERDMSVLMLDSYMKRPYTFFLDTNSGDILRGVNSDISGVAQIVDGFFGFFSELFTFVLICLFLIYLNPIIAIGLIIAVSVCAILIVYSFKGKINKLGKRAREVFARRFEYANQAVGGIKEITVMQRRACFTKQYAEASDVAAACNTSYQFTSRIPNKTIEVAFISSIVLMCTVGLKEEVDIVSVIPQLSAIAVACVRVLPSVSTMTSSINTLVYYRMTLDSACENVKKAEAYEKWLKEYREIKETDSLKYEDKIEFIKSITIEHIKWKYNNTVKNVLDDLSLEIHKGEAIGLVGESGAGKSTLADVLLGLLKPQEGSVMVDGLDIFAMPKQWAKMIGYVPQVVFLADDTIRSNIAFGLPREEIDETLIWQALEQAQLKTYVEKLPEGLDTIVGERGIKFSGGQRQRVAIARALYYNPEILVLDEATSALDTDTETAVMEAIDALQGHKTLIIVAHRLTTIRNCDKVYEIKNGKAYESAKCTI
jgi:ABC-type multidrug transport system fused ATPase/permease subunit